MTQAAVLQPTGTHARILRTLGILIIAAMAMAACSSSTTTTTVADSDAETATQATGAETDDTSDDTEPSAETSAPTAIPAAPAPTAAPVDSNDDADSSGDSTPDVEESSTGTSSVFDGGDFCDVARDLDENDPFDIESDEFDFDVFSQEFFTYVLDLYEGLEAIAPSEISGDIGVVRTGMVEMERIAAQFDYNLFDPGMSEALSVFDSAEFETASVNIENYLVNSCGVDPSGIGIDDDGPVLDEDTQDAIQGLNDLDDDDLALLNELFLSQFNLDPELEECLLANIPDLTQAAADPAILQQELCGTTLFNVFQGLG